MTKLYKALNMNSEKIKKIAEWTIEKFNKPFDLEDYLLANLKPNDIIYVLDSHKIYITDRKYAVIRPSYKIRKVVLDKDKIRKLIRILTSDPYKLFIFFYLNAHKFNELA